MMLGLSRLMWQFIAAGAVVAVVVFKLVGFGVQKERARVEKQDRTNVTKADRAGARSRDPATSGVLDPYRRID